MQSHVLAVSFRVVNVCHTTRYKFHATLTFRELIWNLQNRYISLTINIIISMVQDIHVW